MMFIRRSPSERSGKGCCGQWFAGPPLRAVIVIVALGGFACAFGGAALGMTGWGGSPSAHLTAALLMITVGIILIAVSGAAWRMTAPGVPECLGLGSGELGRCGRRPCSGRAPHGLLYPEFQHRPPPPSYQASMQEYRLRLLLLDRDRQAAAVRASPPPTYRSHAGTLLRAPLSVRCNNTNAGPGSEYSLPPSYRARNNLTRIPTVTAGTGSGHTGDSTSNTMSNANESTCMPAITETRAIITSTNQRHQQQQQQKQQLLLLQQQQQQQQQQQHKQQQQLLQQNSIISDTSAISLPVDTVIDHQNAILVADDTVNNTKISHICNVEDGALSIGPKALISDIDRLFLESATAMTDNKVSANVNDGGDDEMASSGKDLVTIVTISGCTHLNDNTGEMEILAHL